MATVLLAEDDGGVRELIEFVLTGAGHTVIAHGDGGSALTVARTEPFDLAVLDVSMPGLSGLEVCTALRCDPRTAGVPVLLLTAHGGHEDVADGYAAGANDYILKPFSAVDLLARVDTFLAPVDHAAAVSGWDRLAGRPAQRAL